jgi:HSP20 family protein
MSLARFVLEDIDRVFRSFDQALSLNREQSDEYRMPMSSLNYDEENHQYVAEIELPGISKDDINIELQDNRMIITAESSTESKTRKFRHSFTIGSKIDTNSIEANFESGLLILKLKEIKPEVKKIELK